MSTSNDQRENSSPPSPRIRLDHLSVNNFKSLVDFELELAPFTCLIGLNGSGKSTVLHAIHFVARLFRGGMKGWLSQRQWEAADLTSKLPHRVERSGEKPTRKFIIEISLRLHDGKSQIHWQGSFNPILRRCTQESLTINGLRMLHVEAGHYELIYSIPNDLDRMSQVKGEKVRFAYQGSILSQLKDDEIPENILPFKEFMRQTTSLDLLAPQYLRQRARQSGGNLGLGGESLSAFVNELSSEHRKELEEQLRRCYPNLNRIYTSSLRGGWKKLEIGETFGNNKMWSEARHINDGMLRLIAILAELLTKNQFLLFDEIENGINPELVEFLLDALVSARQQLLVTTHSPMILNYLDDDVARAGVQYLYKTPEGFTRSIPFFDIPSVSEKLEAMGPGEAFVDTQLTHLSEEIREMGAKQQDGSCVDPS